MAGQREEGVASTERGGQRAEGRRQLQVLISFWIARRAGQGGGEKRLSREIHGLSLPQHNPALSTFSVSHSFNRSSTLPPSTRTHWGVSNTIPLHTSAPLTTTFVPGGVLRLPIKSHSGLNNQRTRQDHSKELYFGKGENLMDEIGWYSMPCTTVLPSVKVTRSSLGLQLLSWLYGGSLTLHTFITCPQRFSAPSPTQRNRSTPLLLFQFPELVQTPNGWSQHWEK